MAQPAPDSDPWLPWRECDDAALDAVFERPTFDEQCRALLELAPKASARMLSLLPWGEQHEQREFKAIRDRWATERNAKKESERERDEKPLHEVLTEQFNNAVRTGDLKSAKEAHDLLAKIATNTALAKAAKSEDRWDRLTHHETLMLGALAHKLRDEPLTQQDQDLIAYVSLLDAKDEPAPDPIEAA